MYMDNHGIIHTGIAYIPDDCVLEEAFRIKIWKAAEDGFEIIGVTEPQDEFPDEDSIKWAISYFKGTFAEVVKIFYLAKIPFTEEE